MTHEDSKKLLHDYFDEKLSLEANTEIEVHLSECDECSQYLFSIQALMKKADELPRSLKPQVDLWQDIFVQISSIKEEDIKQREEQNSKEVEVAEKESEEEKEKREKKLKAERILEWERRKAALFESIKNPKSRNIIITGSLIFVFLLVYKLFLSSGAGWEVKKLRASDSVYEPFTTLYEKYSFETDEFTKSEVVIPEVGSLFLYPNTKIERLKAYKVRLLSGVVTKSSAAAKKELNIEVLGAEINDFILGSNYRLSIKSPTVSFIEVNDGWVSLKRDNLESLLIPHHSCKITLDQGVGLPYHIYSSNDFVKAIDEYCFVKPGDEEALINLLTKAEILNGVTLWNLLNRVNRKQRDMVVYTILGLLGNLPNDITAEGLKALNPEMLHKLLEELEARI